MKGELAEASEEAVRLKQCYLEEWGQSTFVLESLAARQSTEMEELSREAQELKATLGSQESQTSPTEESQKSSETVLSAKETPPKHFRGLGHISKDAFRYVVLVD